MHVVLCCWEQSKHISNAPVLTCRNVPSSWQQPKSVVHKSKTLVVALCVGEHQLLCWRRGWMLRDAWQSSAGKECSFMRWTYFLLPQFWLVLAHPRLNLSWNEIRCCPRSHMEAASSLGLLCSASKTRSWWQLPPLVVCQILQPRPLWLLTAGKQQSEIWAFPPEFLDTQCLG